MLFFHDDWGSGRGLSRSTRFRIAEPIELDLAKPFSYSNSVTLPVNTQSSRVSSRIRGLTRRRALLLFGLAAGGLGIRTLSARSAVASRLAGSVEAQAGVCIMSAEVTQGPYYLSGQLVRQDITEAKQGFLLNITMTVVDFTNSCNTPPAGAAG